MGVLFKSINIWQRIFCYKRFRIKVENEKFIVPRTNYNNLSYIAYRDEAWLNLVLKSINNNRRINIFLDVGANIGQTLLKIKAINPNVRYIGFEPNPLCFTHTKSLINLNRLSKCLLIPCGLGDESDIAKLRIDQERDLFDSSASIVDGFRKLSHDNYQFVPVYKLDKIIGKFDVTKIDIIKIDIEGAELEAIRGMMDTLTQHKPIIIVEVLPAYDVSNQFRIIRQKELTELISSLDYKIFHIKKNQNDLLFKKVQTFPIHKNVDESDYILLPNTIKLQDLGFNENNYS